MSRTDKDMPWWVTAEEYEPIHNCGWRRKWKYSKEPTGFHSSWYVYRKTGWAWEYLGECDLPTYPDRARDMRNGSGLGRIQKNIPTRCYWEPEWSYTSFARLQARDKPGKDNDRRDQFHGPQRRKVRDVARKAVQGNWEVEFPDGRGRHSLDWYWS